MKDKVRITIVLMVFIAMVSLIMGYTDFAGGGAVYKDGTFKGASENGTTEVTLLIENGEINDVEIIVLKML